MVRVCAERLPFCQVRGLSKDDAMVRGRWKKMIRMLMSRRGVSGWMFLLVPVHTSRPRQRAIKWSCVCVCAFYESCECSLKNCSVTSSCLNVYM